MPAVESQIYTPFDIDDYYTADQIFNDPEAWGVESEEGTEWMADDGDDSISTGISPPGQPQPFPTRRNDGPEISDALMPKDVTRHKRKSKPPGFKLKPFTHKLHLLPVNGVFDSPSGTPSSNSDSTFDTPPPNSTPESSIGSDSTFEPEKSLAVTKSTPTWTDQANSASLSSLAQLLESSTSITTEVVERSMEIRWTQGSNVFRAFTTPKDGEFDMDFSPDNDLATGAGSFVVHSPQNRDSYASGRVAIRRSSRSSRASRSSSVKIPLRISTTTTTTTVISVRTPSPASVTVVSAISAVSASSTLSILELYGNSPFTGTGGFSPKEASTAVTALPKTSLPSVTTFSTRPRVLPNTQGLTVPKTSLPSTTTFQTQTQMFSRTAFATAEFPLPTKITTPWLHDTDFATSAKIVELPPDVPSLPSLSSTKPKPSLKIVTSVPSKLALKAAAANPKELVQVRPLSLKAMKSKASNIRPLPQLPRSMTPPPPVPPLPKAKKGSVPPIPPVPSLPKNGLNNKGLVVKTTSSAPAVPALDKEIGQTSPPQELLSAESESSNPGSQSSSLDVLQKSLGDVIQEPTRPLLPSLRDSATLPGNKDLAAVIPPSPPDTTTSSSKAKATPPRPAVASASRIPVPSRSRSTSRSTSPLRQSRAQTKEAEKARLRSATPPPRGSRPPKQKRSSPPVPTLPALSIAQEGTELSVQEEKTVSIPSIPGVLDAATSVVHDLEEVPPIDSGSESSSASSAATSTTSIETHSLSGPVRSDAVDAASASVEKEMDDTSQGGGLTSTTENVASSSLAAPTLLPLGGLLAKLEIPIAPPLVNMIPPTPIVREDVGIIEGQDIPAIPTLPPAEPQAVPAASEPSPSVTEEKVSEKEEEKEEPVELDPDATIMIKGVRIKVSALKARKDLRPDLILTKVAAQSNGSPEKPQSEAGIKSSPASATTDTNVLRPASKELPTEEARPSSGLQPARTLKHARSSSNVSSHSKKPSLDNLFDQNVPIPNRSLLAQRNIKKSPSMENLAAPSAMVSDAFKPTSVFESEKSESKGGLSTWKPPTAWEVAKGTFSSLSRKVSMDRSSWLKVEKPVRPARKASSIISNDMFFDEHPVMEIGPLNVASRPASPSRASASAPVRRDLKRPSTPTSRNSSMSEATPPMPPLPSKDMLSPRASPAHTPTSSVDKLSELAPTLGRRPTRGRSSTISSYISPTNSEVSKRPPTPSRQNSSGSGPELPLPSLPPSAQNTPLRSRAPSIDRRPSTPSRQNSSGSGPEAPVPSLPPQTQNTPPRRSRAPSVDKLPESTISLLAQRRRAPTPTPSNRTRKPSVDASTPNFTNPFPAGNPPPRTTTTHTSKLSIDSKMSLNGGADAQQKSMSIPESLRPSTPSSTVSRGDSYRPGEYMRSPGPTHTPSSSISRGDPYRPAESRRPTTPSGSRPFSAVTHVDVPVPSVPNFPLPSASSLAQRVRKPSISSSSRPEYMSTRFPPAPPSEADMSARRFAQATASSAAKISAKRVAPSPDSRQRVGQVAPPPMPNYGREMGRPRQEPPALPPKDERRGRAMTRPSSPPREGRGRSVDRGRGDSSSSSSLAARSRSVGPGREELARIRKRTSSLSMAPPPIPTPGSISMPYQVRGRVSPFPMTPTMSRPMSRTSTERGMAF